MERKNDETRITVPASAYMNIGFIGASSVSQTSTYQDPSTLPWPPSLTADLVAGLVQGAPGLGLLALEAFDGGAQLAVAVLEGGPLVVRLLQLPPRVGQGAARALRTRLRCHMEGGGRS